MKRSITKCKYLDGSLAEVFRSGYLAAISCIARLGMMDRGAGVIGIQFVQTL